MSSNANDILKGNFCVKKPVVVEPKKDETLAEDVKKRALKSLGGSMVYIERKTLVWEGNDDVDK